MGGKIQVTADPAATLSANKSRPPKSAVTGADVPSGKGVVIVGGGSGGFMCVETLREVSAWSSGVTTYADASAVSLDTRAPLLFSRKRNMGQLTGRSGPSAPSHGSHRRSVAGQSLARLSSQTLRSWNGSRRRSYAPSMASPFGRALSSLASTWLLRRSSPALTRNAWLTRRLSSRPAVFLVVFPFLERTSRTCSRYEVSRTRRRSMLVSCIHCEICSLNQYMLLA